MTLEKLLNEFIEMGWKPWEKDIIDGTLHLIGCQRPIRFHILRENGHGEDMVVRSLNDLCSIDSGLRQFVVENGLFDEEKYRTVETSFTKNFLIEHESPYDKGRNYPSDTEYRLMLTSILKDKTKFILDNIKI